MPKQSERNALRVRWLDVSGQEMLLEGREGNALTVTIADGAVKILARECLLTECATPGGKPEVKRRVDEMHFTIPLANCRIDWK